MKLMLVGHSKDYDTYQDDKGYTYIYRGKSKTEFDEFIKNIETKKLVSKKEYDEIMKKHLMKKYKR